MRWLVALTLCAVFGVASVQCQTSYGEEKPATSTDNIEPKPAGPGRDGGPSSGSSSEPAPIVKGPNVPPPPAVDGGDGGTGACPNTELKPALFNWKPPPAAAASSASCSNADIAFFEGQLTNSSVTYAELETSMRSRSSVCASCLFSFQSDATWGPFVFYDAKDKTKGAFHNYGACYARASKVNGCGDEVQQWQYCLDDVCNYCVADEDWKTCRANAGDDKAMCGRFDFEKACKGPTTTLDDTCWTTWTKELTAVCGRSL